MRFGRIFYFIAILVCLFEGVRLWMIAPPQMAAHFDIQGTPDRFDTKQQFFTTQLKIVLLVLGLSIATEAMFIFMPVEWINMPNRDYWLAPERRDVISDRLSSVNSVTFATIFLVLLVGLELSVRANLQNPIAFQFQWMLVAIGVAFVLNFIMYSMLMKSFQPPRD